MNPWVRGPPARREGRRKEGLCILGARATGPQGGWWERGRPLHPGCAGHRPAERGGERKASASWVRGPPARKGGGGREEGLCILGARATGPQRGAERGRPRPPGYAGHRPARGWWERGRFNEGESLFLTTPSPFRSREEEWKCRSEGSSCNRSTPACTQRNRSKRNPFSTTIIVLPS